MNNTSIFIKNYEDPSSFYRLFQYLESEKKCKFFPYVNKRTYRWYYDRSCIRLFQIVKKLLFACVGSIRTLSYIVYDLCFLKSKIIIVNRAIFPRIMPPFTTLLLKRYFENRTVYWDFDDNIISDNEITSKECNLLQNYAKEIIVTNEFLRNTIAKEYQDKVILLPTTDKEFCNYLVSEVNQTRLEVYEHNIVLIWIGTKNNLHYLRNILPEIKDASNILYERTKKRIVLNVVSNAKLETDVAEYLQISNIPWTRERAIEHLKNAHIGLMPLEDDVYTRGKGGFKAIQYIGAGIPAIVSNVGFNSKVIENNVSGKLINNQKEWIESIVLLASDKNVWEKYSQNARKKWEDDFNSITNLEFWLDRIIDNK